MDDPDQQAQLGCLALIVVALVCIMIGFWLGTTHS